MENPTELVQVLQSKQEKSRNEDSQASKSTAPHCQEGENDPKQETKKGTERKNHSYDSVSSADDQSDPPGLKYLKIFTCISANLLLQMIPLLHPSPPPPHPQPAKGKRERRNTGRKRGDKRKGRKPKNPFHPHPHPAKGKIERGRARQKRGEIRK